MRLSYLLVTLLMFHLVVSWKNLEEHIVFVDKEDVDIYVGTHPYVLVHWYASWCTFCKEFAPTWSAMSDITYEGKNDFEIIKVELGDDREWKERYLVNAFPDFGVFVNSTYYRYDGKKVSGDLLQFVVNRTSNGILQVSHIDMIEYLNQNSNAVVVGLFEKESTEEQIFIQNVNKDHNVLFVIPTLSVRDQYLKDIKSTLPSLYFLKSFDDYYILFKEEFTHENVKKFINTNSVPIVFPTSNSRYKDYFYNHGREWYTLLIDAEDAIFPSLLTERFIDMCKRIQTTICFYAGFSEKGIYEFFLKGYSVTFPAMLVIHRTRGYYFRIPLSSVERESVESLMFFQNGVMNGGIKMIMRSQPEIKKETEPLHTVVGSNFKSRIMDSNDDVVVLFYSEYCDHCNKMIKRFEKVAEFFNDQDGLQLYKFNSQENDVDIPEIWAKYFHSVLYVKKGEKPILVEYPRSRKMWRTKTLIKWIVSLKDNAEEKKEEENLGEEELYLCLLQTSDS